MKKRRLSTKEKILQSTMRLLSIDQLESIKYDDIAKEAKISRACNFNCYHCFNKEHKDNSQDKEIYFYLLHEVKGHHLNALILGHQGEVFVYYDEILNYLKTLTVTDFKQIIFQTNLSLLSESRIKELKD